MIREEGDGWSIGLVVWARNKKQLKLALMLLSNSWRLTLQYKLAKLLGT